MNKAEIIKSKIKSIMDTHTKCMTGKDVIRLMWWVLFNKEKCIYLIFLLDRGMSFRYACEYVIKHPKSVRKEKVKEYIYLLKKEVK